MYQIYSKNILAQIQFRDKILSVKAIFLYYILHPTIHNSLLWQRPKANFVSVLTALEII